MDGILPVDNDNEQNEVPSEAIAEMPDIDFTNVLNDLFPGDVEDTYSPTPSDRHTRPIRDPKIPTTLQVKGTSFLHLPRELRDEIYYYALASSKPFKVRAHSHNKHPHKTNCGSTRLRERLSSFYYALPFYSSELLETHYRENTLRFLAVHKDNFPLFLDWIHHRGSVLINNIRRLELTHRIITNGPVWLPNERCRMVTTISLHSSGEIEVSSTEPRRPGVCLCGLGELVQERLVSDDALGDAVCQERLGVVERYGKVLGFALQFCEALRLMFQHEDRVRDLSERQRAQMLPGPKAACRFCGMRRWAFHY